jgi:hypothetical protein
MANSTRAWAFVTAIAAGLLIGVSTAAGAGGPIIPSGTFGDGPVGPGGTPGSEFRYVTVGTDPTILVRISTDGGRLGNQRMLDGSWSVPAVTVLGDAGGLSADGNTLVLMKPVYRPRQAERTRMLVVETRRFQTERRLNLEGTFSFDAISPNGRHLYLVQYADPRDPLDYRVRSYDLARGRFEPGSIVDPDEPDEKMTGQPVSRQTSPDGRWAYTLYGGGEETFIHALDTRAGIAQCVDLEQFKPSQLYMLRLDVDSATGAITVLRKNRPEATVTPGSFEVTDLTAAPTAGESVTADDAGGDWVGFAALAVGIALLTGAGLMVVRRHRRAAA